MARNTRSISITARPRPSCTRSVRQKHTGTTVTFWPDPDIFTETTVYDYDTLAARFREMAFLNRGLKIILTDERITDADGNPPH